MRFSKLKFPLKNIMCKKFAFIKSFRDGQEGKGNPCFKNSAVLTQTYEGKNREKSKNNYSGIAILDSFLTG